VCEIPLIILLPIGAILSSWLVGLLRDVLARSALDSDDPIVWPCPACRGRRGAKGCPVCKGTGDVLSETRRREKW